MGAEHLSMTDEELVNAFNTMTDDQQIGFLFSVMNAHIIQLENDLSSHEFGTTQKSSLALLDMVLFCFGVDLPLNSRNLQKYMRAFSEWSMSQEKSFTFFQAQSILKELAKECVDQIL